METADEDFFGTVLAIAPIPLDKHGRQPIEPRDFIMDTGTGYFTPAEFEEKYMSPYYAPHRRAERYGKPE